MNETQSLSKTLMGKEEATDLALGIAKLMRMNSSESYNIQQLPPTSLTTTMEKQNVPKDQNAKLIATITEQSTQNQKLKRVSAPPYLSCVLCRKRCRTKARFLSHFNTHFEDDGAESSIVDQLLNLQNNNRITASDDSDQSSHEEDDDLPPTMIMQHNQRKRKKKSGSFLKFKHSRIVRHNVNIKSMALNSSQPEIDRDSGCHSGRSDCCSSSNIESDNCPGDSELSSSEGESEEYTAVRKPEIRSSVIFKGKTKSQSSSHDSVSRSVSLKDRLSLAEKQLDNNETEGLICLTCLKRFSNCQNLRRHLRLHIARDSITPDIEKQSNGDECTDDDLTEGKYFCDWCPARFDNRSAARIHESTHKGQETKCYICDKSYADRYSLRYHLRTHGIGRQIRCEYCNKSFSKPSRLESHVKSNHHNIRNYPCSVCEKSFKTQVHLENHFRQHSGERPFNCSVCGDSFRHKASLVTHQRSHEGLRPYCCEVCGKTFREPSTLKAHNRVHTGDKPYKCQTCGKTFTQRAGLNYHKQSHTGIKPYKCNFCRFTTVKRSSLSNHYKNIHQMNESQMPPILKYQNAEKNKFVDGTKITEVTEESELEVKDPIPVNNSCAVECNGNYDPIMNNNTSCGVNVKEQCSVIQDTNLKGITPIYNHRPLRQEPIVPLPSPPMQNGDAVFLRNQDFDTSLPSFNHIKTPSRSCSSASSSPIPNDFTSEISNGYLVGANEMHHSITTTPAPIASLSPTSSTTSSTDCNSNQFNLVSSGYNNVKAQHSSMREVSKFTREVTPPLTPPATLISQHQQQTTSTTNNSLDDFMIEDTNECGYLSSTFNISELANQYENYESSGGVSYHETLAYHENITHQIHGANPSLQYRNVHNHNALHNQQTVYQHTQQHQIMQQQDWFGQQQQAHSFNSGNNTSLHHGESQHMMSQNYENASSYAHFNCGNTTSNQGNRGHNNCNTSVAVSQVGNASVNYQATTYQGSVNAYNQQQHHQNHSQQPQHSTLPQQHHHQHQQQQQQQLQLHSTNNAIAPSQVNQDINGSVSGSSAGCHQQQQSNYPQQQSRQHQGQVRGPPSTTSYSISGEASDSRASSDNVSNLGSSLHVNDSYCQNSFVSV